MATFGFPFRPWPHKGTLGQGADIKEYIRDVARDCGALERLRTGSWIKDADWQTDKNLYAVTSVTDKGSARSTRAGSTTPPATTPITRDSALTSPARRTSPDRSSTRRSGRRT